LNKEIEKYETEIEIMKNQLDS